MIRVNRRGFTLFEAVVGVAIAATLAFAIYWTFDSLQASSSGSQYNEDAIRADKAAATLFDLANAIAALETTNPPESFLQTVGAYPSRLSQLTTPITGTDTNSCRRATDRYSTAAVPTPVANPGYTQGWKGPYYILSFVRDANTQINSGFVVQDVMLRIPANPGNNPQANDLAGRLQIVMPSVTQADAVALDARVDQTLDGNAGTVRYGAGDPTTLYYEIRVSGC